MKFAIKPTQVNSLAGSLVKECWQKYLDEKLNPSWLCRRPVTLYVSFYGGSQTVEFSFVIQPANIDDLLSLQLVKHVVAPLAKNAQVVGGAINQVTISDMVNAKIGNAVTERATSANGDCLTAKALPMIGFDVFEIRFESTSCLC